jgi:hypothetical protein
MHVRLKTLMAGPDGVFPPGSAIDVSVEEDEALPAVAYLLEDERSVHTMAGPSALRQAIYRFDIWADTAAEAMAVARQLLTALDGYRGSFKDVPIAGALFDGAGRTRDPGTETFNVSMRFTIHYQERPT